jgi:hypothetical protein
MTSMAATNQLHAITGFLSPAGAKAAKATPR